MYEVHNADTYRARFGKAPELVSADHPWMVVHLDSAEVVGRFHLFMDASDCADSLEAHAAKVK